MILSPSIKLYYKKLPFLGSVCALFATYPRDWLVFVWNGTEGILAVDTLLAGSSSPLKCVNGDAHFL